MDCKYYSNLIHDFVENELDAQIADAVSAHVFTCENCEAEFEKLSREKEFYSQFLFEIEPPRNLANRFQARLENEPEIETFAPIPQKTFGSRLANIFSWCSPSFALAALCALLIFGFGFFWLKNSSSDNGAKFVASEKNNPATPAKNSDENLRQILPPANEPETAKIATPAQDFNQASFVKVSAEKTNRGKNELSKNLLNRQKRLENPARRKTPRVSEDELKVQQLQEFAQETAEQIEKIEMLLRSFRNARFSEETEAYDVSYEKQQARKLLLTTEKLRLQAEVYGDFYTGETLDKVQPYLLDIANLGNNPPAEAILDIKQRVKNQNLIASLQTF